MNLKKLSKCTIEDIEKRKLIYNAIKDNEVVEIHSLHMDMKDFCLKESILHAKTIEPTKFCPKCHKKYPEKENFCFECAVALKQITDVNVRAIKINPKFTITKTNTYNDFKEILTESNLANISSNDFDIDEIVKNIKVTALKRLDSTIKENDILLEDLNILEKAILFVKSFVDVEYKSYGPELGYYEFNKIYIDDRQTNALQITTLLHELAHFLNKEIFVHVLCELLDCSKTTKIESIATYILTYSPLNQLIDEYAAHTVEGRFTLYGFQDYSSFLNIQKTIDLPDEEIEMLKTIGNSLANIIKDILESFIDSELLEDIKTQFRKDIMDRPDYKNLLLENCTMLNDYGLVNAFRFLLADGFAVAMDDPNTLEQYNSKFDVII